MLSIMKKGILLSFAAIILMGVIVYALWYINKRGELTNNSKDSFIPWNSALVVSLNPGAALSVKVQAAFAEDIRLFRQKPLYKTVDTLIRSNYAASTSRVLALRIEGKNKPAFLWVMDNRDVLSRNEIVNFLKNVYPETGPEYRKYDNYRIYQLKAGTEVLYYAVEEGMILVSDSELYLEDALKQFENEAEQKQPDARYENVKKYFSAGAGLNVFLNSTCFSEVLPMLIHPDKIFRRLDMTQCFEWGALDGDMDESGIVLNGFMHYGGSGASYMKTMEGQRPKESVIENIIPLQSQSLLLLNLSDLKAYLAALDNYRYDSGIIEKIRKKKQEYMQQLGKTAETELRELLQGEFAQVSFSFNESTGETEGAVIASLKSGGLCRAWLEKVIEENAVKNNVHPDSYRKSYQTDREKAFAYYKFPATDMAGLYWGGIFDGIKNNYALIEDNYLILASSEKVIAGFLNASVHRSFISDAGWFKKVKSKMAAKYNLAYFAETSRTLPYYSYVARSGWKDFLNIHREQMETFSTWAMQWSNEGNMLYSSLFLSTDQMETAQRPHVLWQTKLGASVSMKPVSVVNHVTGEREILVQDEAHTVYLLNNSGRILWKRQLDGKINSEVYQVDVFKNGKLQYLFSTASRLYLIDRNGEKVGNFPVAFRAACDRGITVFDYDKNRNYRVFAPCADRKVYLYDLIGNPVKGWDNGKADKEIMTRVQHYRVGDKDYIVFADRYRLYILDRKGKERAKVSTVFDLAENTPLYLFRKNGKAQIVFANMAGPVNLVDFSGHTQTVKCAGIEAGHHLNVADVNNDGQEEFIFTNGRHLKVFDPAGKLLTEKELNVQNLDFPYVYRFSDGDIRIGLLDSGQKHMIMLTSRGEMSQGFPIRGESPFSIVFAENGNFYLFAGVEEGNLIKYRIQR